MAYQDKTLAHIRSDERNHVAKPLLDQFVTIPRQSRGISRFCLETHYAPATIEDSRCRMAVSCV